MISRFFVFFLVGLVSSCLAQTVHAIEQSAAVHSLTTFIVDGGSSSRAARQEAIKALPLDRIPKPHQQLIAQCIRETTLYRHLPPQTFSCDNALLDFSFHKPEAIVDIWRMLGITRLSLDPAGSKQWRFSDGYGTVGGVRLVHEEHHGKNGLLVFHGRGAYTGSLAPRVLTGSCVILVQYSPVGRNTISQSLQKVEIDAFVDMDGAGLEIVTRTLQPLIVRSAAVNLHEICVFMSNFSGAAETNPEGVIRMVKRLPRTGEEEKTKLVAITRAVGNNRVRAASAIEQPPIQTQLAARWLPQNQ